MMRYNRIILLLLVALMLTNCSHLLRRDMKLADSPGQHPKVFKKEITKTVSCNYLLYLPEDYGKEKKLWPMILFLHGFSVGERGDDFDLIGIHGPPKLVSQGKQFPFIIVSPQCPENEWWSNEVLINLLDEVIDKYSVDPDRVYLTGLSMGGYGAWHLALAYPDRFAAVAPICGGGIPGIVKYVEGVKDLPVWVFHGAKDPVVPISESEKMVDVFKEMGREIKFTVYPEAMHDSWTKTYNNPELYEWFLEHNLKDRK